MYISNVYLTSYSKKTAISGNMTVKTDTGEIMIKIPTETCVSIQNILVETWVNHQKELAQEILTKTPAIESLPAPENFVIEEGINDLHIEDANFEDII